MTPRGPAPVGAEGYVKCHRCGGDVRGDLAIRTPGSKGRRRRFCSTKCKDSLYNNLAKKGPKHRSKLLDAYAIKEAHRERVKDDPEALGPDFADDPRMHGNRRR